MSKEKRMEIGTWIALAALAVSFTGLVAGGLGLLLHFYESPFSPWRKAKLEYYTEVASGPPFDESHTRSNGVAVYFHVLNTSKVVIWGCRKRRGTNW